MIFRYLIITSFLLTVALELYAIVTGNYTISDFLLGSLRMRYRVFFVFGLCAYLIYHFTWEYPSYK